MSADQLFRRLWSRLRKQGHRPARLILVNEYGSRVEYVHGGEEDPILWAVDGTDMMSGWRALSDEVEEFLSSRGGPHGR